MELWWSRCWRHLIEGNLIKFEFFENSLESGILFWKFFIQCFFLTSNKDYIPIKGKAARYIPHTAGRYQVKRFRKALCPIVERMCCSLMMHGRNNGKKLMTVRIIKHTFEIIHLLTGENPLKILVDAIKNSGPREDSTRIGRAGTVRRQAVDVSPLRRVNQAIWLLCTGNWLQHTFNKSTPNSYSISLTCI